MGREARLRAVDQALRTIAIGIANGGQVHTPFMLSLLKMNDRLARLGWNLVLLPETGFFIEDNRVALVRRFLTETDADWLLMIDSDISFPPDLVEMLLAATAVGDGRKVIAASVPLSNGGATEADRIPSCAFRMTDRPGVWTYVEAADISPYGSEVGGLAMPVFMCHRDVYRAIARNVGPSGQAEGQVWFYRHKMPLLTEERSRRAWEDPDGNVEDRRWLNLGEDLSFCLRAIDAGYKLWCYRLPGLRHHKTALPLSHDDQVADDATSTAAPAEMAPAAMEG